MIDNKWHNDYNKHSPVTVTLTLGWCIHVCETLTATQSDSCWQQFNISREILRAGGASLSFVYLKGSPEMIKRRLENRENHYFKAGLLQTQFDTLEVYSRSIKQNNKSIKREIYILGTKWWNWGVNNCWLQSKFGDSCWIYSQPRILE